MSINGIYHIGCIGHYKSVIKEQLLLLHKKDIYNNNSLYNILEKLIIFLTDISIKDYIHQFDPDNKFFYYSVPVSERENYTINNFRQYLSENVQYIFYFHTKGVSHKEGVYQERRKILNYYILEHYRLCLELLEKNDVVGCSLYQYPQLHFSGNFWWTTKSYLDTLPLKINNNYLTPEMFIGYTTKKNPLYISLSQKTNHDSLFIHKKRTKEIIKKNITKKIFQNYWNKNLIKYT